MLRDLSGEEIDALPRHLRSQHDPDRCEAIIPGTKAHPIEEYQSNRCTSKKGHRGPHGADFCFWRDEELPERERAMSEQESYDWATDPTAQDVIDALRLVLVAQDDPEQLAKLTVCLVEYAPETETSRGIDLLMRLISEATVKVALK